LATYPIVNKETGEKKEVVMSVNEWDDWKKDNVDWIRDWSDPSTAPNSCELGDWQNKLTSKHPGWNEILKKAGSVPGSNVKPL
jgi:hypothetical protein